MNRFFPAHAALISSVVFSEPKSPSHSTKKCVREFHVIICTCFIMRVSEEMLQAKYSLVMSLNGRRYLKGVLSLENKPYWKK